MCTSISTITIIIMDNVAVRIQAAAMVDREELSSHAFEFMTCTGLHRVIDLLLTPCNALLENSSTGTHQYEGLNPLKGKLTIPPWG